MSREWLRNVNKGLLLEIIEHRAQRDQSTGKVSFDLNDGMFHDALAVLESSVRFDEATPESMYAGLIHSSLRAIAKSRTLTVKAFESELGKRERAYLARTPERYVLTTSMSATRVYDLLPRTGIADTHITFGAQLPKLFQQDHERMRQQGSGVLFGDLPKTTGMMKRYTFARVSIRAKSQVEAVESALEGLNLLRGIWNFYQNYRTPWRSSFRKRKPVNKIVLGPIHSLHWPNGKLATDGPWYEPDYVGPLEPITLDRNFESMRKLEGDFRRYLARSRYRTDLEDSIRWYGRVLDSRDWNTDFVQLWGLLEHLTDTTKTESKLTCKRARFLYPKEERDLHREVLHHLAHHRNQAVHAGYVTERAETLLYQLKLYVERLLLFHLFVGVDFQNRTEAADFLHLPPDLDDLQKRIRLMRRAMKLHGQPART